MAVVCSAIELVAAPLVAVVVIAVQCEDLLPSHSRSHTSFLGVGHKRDSLYLHARPSDKKCSISSLAS